MITLLTMLAVSVGAQTPNVLEVKELTLSNGMKVWLNEDHSQPKVYGAVVVNAGAKDCPDTGIAHYFEHIMFKGTDQIGTVNYEAEKPWLDSIAAAYDRLAAARDEAQRADIQRDINRLSQRAAEYAIPNEFNGLISRYGGSGLNAGTSYDFTFYYNTFTSQYIQQWCQLNSDRLINPVFRMFQGELETVYEEKNMGSDDMATQLRERVMQELFGTQPYAYPVIGSTENLKNPKLSEMKAFYEKYYVGCNMGLILAGDINTNDLMPMLERTFGRIPAGTKPTRRTSPLPDIRQERTLEIKLPVPIINMEMLVFKAPTAYEADANALDIASKLLSNDKAGLLDSLENEGRLMATRMMPMALNDAGVAMLLVVPNLLSKTQKAEDACLQQMRRVIDGDFSQQTLELLKQEARREAWRQLETLEERAMQMVMVMTTGHTWQEYIDKVNAIETLTKSDVMAAAQRCFGKPFVRFKKKFGSYDKDRITQPGYTPVVAKNRNAESDYAQRLAQMPVDQRQPRIVDFNTDAHTVTLAPQATLYTVKNPVNRLFQLTVCYNRGEKADPRLGPACELLNASGTDSLSRQQLGAALQQLGADITFESADDALTITVNGEDEQFEPTMQLVAHFLSRVSPNDKALANMKDAVKAAEKALTEENTEVLKALLAKVGKGGDSPYLRRMTYKEVKKLSGDELIAAFRGVQASNCYVTYSGTLADDIVERGVRTAFPVEKSTQPYIDYRTDYLAYDAPVVYVFDMRKARQTLVFTYEQLKAQPTREGRIPAALLSSYFGGGMSSVLFQEVREFRSMAYSTGSRLMTRPRQLSPQAPMAFVSVLGTQGDKTMAAVALVDSLLKDMPVVEKNFLNVRQEYLNSIDDEYPSFRDMGAYIAELRQMGYAEDSKSGLATLIEGTTIDDMIRYYQDHVKGDAQHRVFGIIGNKKKLNLKQLAKYGKVVVVKEKDLFKK